MLTGFEGLRAPTNQYSQIQILSGMSKPIQNGLEGAAHGHFWDRDGQESLGKTIDVVPVIVEDLCFEAKEMPGATFPKIIKTHEVEVYYDYSSSGKYPVTNNVGNILTLSSKHTYLVKVGEDWEPYILYWSKTNYKYSAMFINIMQRTKDITTLWGGVWRLSTIKLTNGKGAVWYGLGKDRDPCVEFVDFAPDSLSAKIMDMREEWARQKELYESAVVNSLAPPEGGSDSETDKNGMPF